MCGQGRGDTGPRSAQGRWSLRALRWGRAGAGPLSWVAWRIPPARAQRPAGDPWPLPPEREQDLPADHGPGEHVHQGGPRPEERGQGPHGAQEQAQPPEGDPGPVSGRAAEDGGPRRPLPSRSSSLSSLRSPGGSHSSRRSPSSPPRCCTPAAASPPASTTRCPPARAPRARPRTACPPAPPRPAAALPPTPQQVGARPARAREAAGPQEGGSRTCGERGDRQEPSRLLGSKSQCGVSRDRCGGQGRGCPAEEHHEPWGQTGRK